MVGGCARYAFTSLHMSKPPVMRKIVRAPLGMSTLAIIALRRLLPTPIAPATSEDRAMRTRRAVSGDIGGSMAKREHRLAEDPRSFYTNISNRRMKSKRKRYHSDNSIYIV